MTTKTNKKPTGDLKPLADLRPDPTNPRKQSKAAADGLDTSLDMFGELAVITFNESTGELVAGHKRIEALTRAGAKGYVRDEGADFGYIEHPATKEHFVVRFVSWDKSKQTIANLTANNPYIQGEFTEDALEQLREIDDTVARGALGLDSLLKELESREVKLPDEATGDGSDDQQIATRFVVMVECKSDGEQHNLIERLISEGYDVKAMSV